ncbi:MAG TPA: hypothetical protein PK263_04760, partial [bacterium]|nr:hypothetical protein [bacterium]
MKTAIVLVVVWLATILVVMGGFTVLNQVVVFAMEWATAFSIALAVAGLAVCFIAGCTWAAEVK